MNCEMDREKVEDVVIIGAGIAGLATALSLHRVGVRPLVLEKAKELRATGAALTLFPNAWLALDALGVSHKLTALYKPTFNGTVTNVVTGAIHEISLAANIGNEGGPRVVHRRALLEALANELPVSSLHFSCKPTGFEIHSQEGSSVTAIHMEDGTTIKTKVLIGCDGVHSIVARWLGLRAVASSGRWAVRGLATYTQGHDMEQEVWQYVDTGKRAGFAPLNEKELYWFITFQSASIDDTIAGTPESIRSELVDNYAKNFPARFMDVVEHAELSTLSITPLVFRYPWDIIFGTLSKGNVTVHPMTPDLGQGGCSALEDAVYIGRYMGESFIKNQKQLVTEDITRAIQKYGDERRWRVAALISGSYIAGWGQQGGSSWLKKFIRDSLFYKFLFGRLLKFAQHDCGRLPNTDGLEQANPLNRCIIDYVIICIA